MADTVSDVAEVLGTPEKEVVDKVVEEVEDVDEDSGDVQEDSEGDSEEVKENGTSTENGDKELGSGEAHAKNGDSNGVAKESDVIASKRKSGGGDAPDGLLTEGASPEKKAKLDEPVEVDANGDAEVVA